MTIADLYKWALQNGYENFPISIEYKSEEDGYICTPLSITDSAITVENGVIYIDI